MIAIACVLDIFLIKVGEYLQFSIGEMVNIKLYFRWAGIFSSYY